MTSAVVRFPPRRLAAVFVCPERAGEGWLAIAGSNGWLHGERNEALETARWLASNLGGVPVREVRA
jgi:hypothetical protein